MNGNANLFLAGGVAGRIVPWVVLAMVGMHLGTASGAEEALAGGVELRVSWGHTTGEAKPFFLKLIGQEIVVSGERLEEGESTDRLEGGVVRSRAGGGDVDGLRCRLGFDPKRIEPITNAQPIWRYLLTHGDQMAADRLRSEPAYRPDSRKLTFILDEAGLPGFSLTADQLLRNRVFWLADLDVYVRVGGVEVSFGEHREALRARGGERVLGRVARSSEATYTEYAARWEDMGKPAYRNPHGVAPGHIVGLTWDSALYKFGVDRLGGVWNDNGKLDRFHFSVEFGEAAGGMALVWKEQRLEGGLPVITTVFEEAGIRFELEQFAYPLDGPPAGRRGDIGMVLFEKVTLSELAGEARKVPVRLIHEREVAPGAPEPVLKSDETGVVVEDNAQGIFLAVEARGAVWPAVDVRSSSTRADDATRRVWTNYFEVVFELPAKGKREFVAKLPSPSVGRADRAKLLALDWERSRASTIAFWDNYIRRGAQFRVPEEAVNRLFRANLWHALRLPRRHGAEGPGVKIDLPYSNFAYDQNGTPWPVNQAVYVDYMIYDLRGYHEISAEELAVMYANNQRTNGHIGGIANWGVYTPAMLYTVAQHYLLSGDRESFERMLPQTLRAVDWCMGQVRGSDQAKGESDDLPGGLGGGAGGGSARGMSDVHLVLAPLNDLSHERRSWAFNQAYFAAGLELLGRALGEIGHARAAECRAVAGGLRAAIEREFGRAAVRSPAVELADGTWSIYVPCDAQASGRLLSIWYPTDVDTGALHLSRLRALDPGGALTTALLHDHEDNLFFNQWGMANEPVYNQQGAAYLFRDEPKAVIRAFYSMMACAFSHTVFEPVEHRWGWGQYFGPPSTDGAWFELYRRMLIHEREDGALLLGQATPRLWLEDGKRIEVERAPTYYGPLSFSVESRARAGEIAITVEMPARKRPAALLVRVRHPESKPIRSVSVDGREWTDFDSGKEWVRIPDPAQSRYRIVTRH